MKKAGARDAPVGLIEASRHGHALRLEMLHYADVMTEISSCCVRKFFCVGSRVLGN